MVTFFVVGLVMLVGVGSWGYRYGGWRGYVPGSILGVIALVLIGAELVLLRGD